MEIFKESFMAEKKEYLYNYRGLDRFLENFVDAPSLAGHLDELLFILVTHISVVEREQDCGWELLELYAVLSDLHTVFDNLEKKAG
ncbi:hypothetical protein A3SI_19932 [Nitritalea halalkaliphila LW7]|uniref:Uncharacterized protein n=1 Tax=Nitritalea halalkaliphila LW7 TaxID=1189621 RepID=I5BRT8_9BACT|nr:hypothetical protein [Nitritalea halalkaliphila]EIM72290.1 hypothetical protein A3SI_19932 [Nitritalea halalkaliphila LW7]